MPTACVVQDETDTVIDGDAFLDVCASTATATCFLADCPDGDRTQGSGKCSGHALCDPCQTLCAERGVEFKKVTPIKGPSTP